MARRSESTVVIPAFNNAALTRQCLDAVLRGGHCRVIVVNDASTDDTAAVLAGFGKRIRVITHKTNQGFARTCNAGARAARSKFVVFLNNDTLPQPGWLRALENHARRQPQAAVIGSKLVYPDNTIQHAGVVICQDGYPRHVYTGFPAEHPAVNRSRRFQLVTAASMLVRREVFQAAGGFDAKFRNGFEDVDFCLRLGGRGHEVHYCAESVVEHFESVSPGRFKHDKANIALYRKRWLKRVAPDEFQFYAADGLLAADHEGRYPFSLEIAPELATVSPRRNAKTERALREQGRRLAAAQRENTRLRLALSQRAEDSPELRYQELRAQCIAAARRATPRGARILVISKGDGALLDIPGRKAEHFPQTKGGAYAGHHPASGNDAVNHLKSLCGNVMCYLMIPATSQWWLQHYPEFRRHLDRSFTRVENDPKTCSIYCLGKSKARR